MKNEVKKSDIQKYHLATAIIVFMLLPVMFFYSGDFPRRSVLKETLSLLTVFGFALLLGQFFWARSNQFFVRPFKFSRVLSVHKFIGYTVVAVFLAHPCLIVLPRFYEGGISPVDALIQTLTTFNSLGVILGLVSWVLALVLLVTSLFRERLFINYKTWKLFHGILAIVFVSLAAWHAIELGRHTDAVISVFFALLAIWGSSILIRRYVRSSRIPTGAR